MLSFTLSDEECFKAGNTVKYAYVAAKLHRKFASAKD